MPLSADFFRKIGATLWEISTNVLNLGRRKRHFEVAVLWKKTNVKKKNTRGPSCGRKSEFKQCPGLSRRFRRPVPTPLRGGLRREVREGPLQGGADAARALEHEPPEAADRWKKNYVHLTNNSSFSLSRNLTN